MELWIWYVKPSMISLLPHFVQFWNAKKNKARGASEVLALP